MGIYEDRKGRCTSVTSLVNVARSALISNTTVTTGATVDLAGATAANVVWAIGSAATTAGTGGVTPQLEESTDDVTFGTVAAADIIESTAGDVHYSGTAAPARMWGYIGSKRYIRAVVTVVGTPSFGVGAQVVKYMGGIIPTSKQ